MAQTYTVNCYGLDNEVLVDLGHIEENFAALKTNFSGANDTALSGLTEAGMRFYDTTKKLMKVRNSVNTAWLAKASGDANSKIWAYKNTAPDGMAIDSAITDRVVALKGGSGSYNVNGGNQAGTWTQPDHTLTVDEVAAHTHGSGGAHTHLLPVYPGWGIVARTYDTVKFEVFIYGSTYSYYTASGGAHEHTSVGGGGAHNHGTAYRPAAAVGTVQYIDI